MGIVIVMDSVIMWWGDSQQEITLQKHVVYTRGGLSFSLGWKQRLKPQLHAQHTSARTRSSRPITDILHPIQINGFSFLLDLALDSFSADKIRLLLALSSYCCYLWLHLLHWTESLSALIPYIARKDNSTILL